MGTFESVAVNVRRAIAPLRTLLEEGRTTGELVAADPDLAAVALAGALNLAAISQIVTTGTLDAEATARALVPQLLGGIIPRQPTCTPAPVERRAVTHARVTEASCCPSMNRMGPGRADRARMYGARPEDTVPGARRRRLLTVDQLGASTGDVRSRRQWLHVSARPRNVKSLVSRKRKPIFRHLWLFNT
jgi:hypothetical protein